MEYTRGEWKATEDADVRTEDGLLIALGYDPHDGSYSTPEALANARLIAAAPDMYEALKRLVKETRPYAYQGMLNEAEKALDKAEGK